jgi:catechol-2,3-dioxygenase
MVTKVNKVGFVGFNSVKFDEMKHHYADILGMPISHQSAKEAFFSCGNDSITVSLRRGDAAGFNHVGLQVEGEGPLDDVLKQLGADGVKGSLKSDLYEGVPSCIEIADPDGYTVYLYRTAPYAQDASPGVGVMPHKLGHVALLVGDAKQTTKFYTDVLGFRWSDWLGDFFSFMRCNADHHSMNFMNAPKRGLFHVAFELHDFSHLGRGCDILANNDVRVLWGPGRHGMGHNIFTYHRDPDGNIVELFTDLDRMSDETLGYFDPRPYHADHPQRPKVWSPDDPKAANSWGPKMPDDFM